MFRQPAIVTYNPAMGSNTSHPSLFTTKVGKCESAKEDVFVDCQPFFRPFVLSRFPGDKSFDLAL
jgi:hypothetical protein